MRYVSDFSLRDYVQWYLCREQRKRRKRHGERFDIPGDYESQKALVITLEKFHTDWFENSATTWGIVQLEQCEFERLIPAYQSFSHQKLARRGENSGILREMAKVARQINYLDCDHKYIKPHRCYYQEFLEGQRKLVGDDRIFIVTEDRGIGKEGYINPHGFFHLEDGWGRCLPYQILLLEGRITFGCVEAICACHPDDVRLRNLRGGAMREIC